MTTTDRETFRSKILQETPSWYNPYLHFLVPSVFGLGMIVLAGFLVENILWWEWFTIPLTYLLSNTLEWYAHRDLLHKRQPWAPVLYDRHTPLHHRLYVTDQMAMKDIREFRQVLIPAYGILLLFFITTPLTTFLWLVVSPNVACLFAATSMGYVVGYEWLHLSYHLPENHPIGRLGPIQKLKHHHAVHHNPQLMQQWNMNVTVPFFDWVKGTVYKGIPL